MDISHSEAVRKNGTGRMMKIKGAVIPIIRSHSKANGVHTGDPETTGARRQQPDDGSSKIKRMKARRDVPLRLNRVIVERPVDQLRVATTNEDLAAMGEVNRKTGTVAGGTATEIRAMADCLDVPRHRLRAGNRRIEQKAPAGWYIDEAGGHFRRFQCRCIGCRQGDKQAAPHQHDAGYDPACQKPVRQQDAQRRRPVPHHCVRSGSPVLTGQNSNGARADSLR